MLAPNSEIIMEWKTPEVVGAAVERVRAISPIDCREPRPAPNPVAGPSRDDYEAIAASL